MWAMSLGRSAVVMTGLSFAILVRVLVSMHPHSGMSVPPMYGDYEAQRHWMEITINQPLRDWYRNTTDNDLLYWGLDYPPLTAYVSWLCGLVSRALEPPSMALHTSRGYQTTTHKVFMRLSVLVLDLLLFFPGVWALAPLVTFPPRGGRPQAKATSTSTTATAMLAFSVLMQPSLITIDYGHFQYNSTCLGLALLGVAGILHGHPIWGSVLFCLSLNFKQIALYYSTAFFFFLLRKCWCGPSPLIQVIKLGVAVITSFALLWAPFCVLTAQHERGQGGCLTGLGHVLRRLFPFNRGLFEDKVANFWYTTSIVMDLRSLIPVDRLALISLGTTLLGILPSSINLLVSPPTPRRFLLALVNSSLSFFMFSFQVHEKSLLFPLVPAAFLVLDEPLLVWWLAILGNFSMFPLFQRDRIILPYLATSTIYSVCLLLTHQPLSLRPPSQPASPSSSHLLARFVFSPYSPAKKFIVTASLLIMVVVHSLHMTVAPSARYPHIYPLLYSATSAVFLGLVMLYTNALQWRLSEPDDGLHQD